MFYYTLDNNKIEQFAEIQDSENVPVFMQNWLSTDEEIVVLKNGTLAFKKDIAFDDIRVEMSIAEIMQQQVEAEALKPTAEDLAEALAILADIVLGGAE